MTVHLSLKSIVPYLDANFSPKEGIEHKLPVQKKIVEDW